MKKKSTVIENFYTIRKEKDPGLDPKQKTKNKKQKTKEYYSKSDQ